MSTGAQDWTMSDAAREILVLTKNDEEPGNFGVVCSPQVDLRLQDLDFRKIMIDIPGEARYTRTKLAFSHHRYPHQNPE